MQKRTATKTEIKKERDLQKVREIVRQKGYPDGKLPSGKQLHHIKPVAQKGKTTLGNTRVVTVAEHKRIHANRRNQGKI